MSRRKLNAEMAERIAGSFDTHVMEEVFETRSFRFTNVRLRRSMDILPSGVTLQRLTMERTGAYSFGLTWRPGHLMLTGDLGELTLVHYHALGTFGSIAWALSADHDYLMSKTNVQREYDPEATLEFIREELNRPVIEFLNGHRSSGHIWPKHHAGEPTQGPVRYWERRHSGFRHELQDFRRAAKARAQEIAGGAHEDEWDAPERPILPLVVERRDRWRHASDRRRPVSQEFEVPDHLESWARAAHAVFEEATLVNTRQGRDDVWHEIERVIEDRHEAIDFLQRAGFDDYYGSEKWNERSYWQIAAIQHGVRMICAREFPGLLKENAA